MALSAVHRRVRRLASRDRESAIVEFVVPAAMALMVLRGVWHVLVTLPAARTIYDWIRSRGIRRRRILEVAMAPYLGGGSRVSDADMLRRDRRVAMELQRAIGRNPDLVRKLKRSVPADIEAVHEGMDRMVRVARRWGVDHVTEHLDELEAAL